MMEAQIVETWAIHNRINLYLLDAIPDNALGASLPTKSRTVHDLFAHIHNVRLMWLKSAAPALLEGLNKLETKIVGDKSDLRTALESSGRAIESLLHQAMADGGKVKGFKPHAVAFLGYLISHESHHRGQVGWALSHRVTLSIKKPPSAFGNGESAELDTPRTAYRHSGKVDWVKFLPGLLVTAAAAIVMARCMFWALNKGFYLIIIAAASWRRSRFSACGTWS